MTSRVSDPYKARKYFRADDFVTTRLERVRVQLEFGKKIPEFKVRWPVRPPWCNFPADGLPDTAVAAQAIELCCRRRHRRLLRRCWRCHYTHTAATAAAATAEAAAAAAATLPLRITRTLTYKEEWEERERETTFGNSPVIIVVIIIATAIL